MKSDSLIRIRDLFKSQTLAVLATFYESQPYCNLVAFAGTDDCKFMIFATNRNTSKYKNLHKNHQVSLLVDDRTNLNDDFGKNVAITALGLAEEVSPQEKPYLAELLISKHPDIASFIKGSDNTIFKVRISNYIVAGLNSVEVLQVED
jgi:nitroimidazol reductase NimA-like FMN-containing flavoprotein (pyridoxamine 5'-phosphate oxidase superfamily)